ncbi:MAG: sigma-54-dependent Fis family transcriptional regulator [Deltaproteobacteria bacterium]|nr:sigma-54-dependent Fis family transcriptional regulator [Deltaproteobacteria bacterium]
MRVADIDLRELLTFEPGGGVMRLGGQRVVLLDTVALGLLRKELIESLGTTAARAVLTRFGYAHGWRTAESMRSAFPWDSELEWQRAGGRLHMLHGMVVLDASEPVGDGGAPPIDECTWRDSYEVEQHLLQVGRSEEPVCWTLAGFASGYFSFCRGREIYCVERRCRGKGDPECYVVARYKEDWGPEVAAELRFYEKASVDAALGEVTAALRRAERRLRSRRNEIARLSAIADDPSGMVARSEALQRVLDLARRIAKVDSTVIVTGESGVGKERIARLIHDESGRASRPFLAVNCGAVTETLLESELFGHAKGAFTGAEKDRVGLFEAAEGGTLFLDEVGEVPPAMQVKLLRALQEKEIRRVGENRSRRIDVRVVAATNRNLAEEVEAGRFRQDLYYRLRVIELRVPPLRKRTEDILPMARVFLSELSARMGRSVTGFTPAAAEQLLRHDWAGNVRELQNAVEYAVALCRGDRVDVQDLPEDLRSAPPRLALSGPVRTLEEAEREYVLAVLDRAGGNRTHAAVQLGIAHSTLLRKLKRYGENA